MIHWSSLAQIPADFGPSVVTLGNFDGVHRGHQAVVARVVAQARSRHASAVAVTFTPHPVAVLHPDRAPAEITCPEQRIHLLRDLQVDATLELEFTREFAQLTPQEFVRSVFIEALGATAVVVGTDTRFGVHNCGDIDTMRQLGAEYGFDVIALDPVGEQVQDSRHWSSTRARMALGEGDVDTAAEVLGRWHRVTGEVVHGHHRGRELGYPTANLGGRVCGMIPADGVYAGWLERFDLPDDHADRRLPTAVSVGSNPTFDDVLHRTVEAYVLDRTDLDLYHERVGVDFVARLRGNLRFDSIEDLISAMSHDVETARSLLHP